MIQYKVIALTPKCCSANVKPLDVEGKANEFAAQGYTLVEAYVDVTGGICQKKSTILIFQKL
ncbi:MAG: hypothetical protein WC974_04500 [Thermoplasmata archaeon]